MSTLKRLIGFFSSFINASALVEAKKEAAMETPKFLLPETGEDYKHRLREAHRTHNKKMSAYLEVCRQHRELVSRPGTALEQELNRRKAQSMACFPPIEPDPEAIERVVRVAEWQKIADKGNVILSTSKKIERMFETTERRVVEFQGRFFLVVISIREKTIGSGEWRDYGYGQGHWTVVNGTGEFFPPEIKFVTDSLSQLTNDELRTVAAASQ